MKLKNLSRYIKKAIVVAMSGIVLCSGGITAKAATSDQVTLSPMKPGVGHVTTVSSSLRVRQEPTTTSAMIASLPSGSKAMIVGRENNFFKVQYDLDGHYGYVSSQYFEEEVMDYYLMVNNEPKGVNFRSGAGTNYKPYKTLSSYTRLAVDEVYLGAGHWQPAVYGNESGYIYGDYVVGLHY